MHRTEMSAPRTEVVDQHPPASFLPPEPSSARLLSLDVFRGLAVAGMILVDSPGDDAAAYWPIKHAGWNGWTPPISSFHPSCSSSVFLSCFPSVRVSSAASRDTTSSSMPLSAL